MVKKSTLTKLINSGGKILDLMSPSEENVHAIMDWIMPDLDPNDLKRSLIYYYQYLETNDEKWKPYFDPLPVLFYKYNFIQKHMKLTIRVGRTWWPYIQKYISNPDYVVEMIGRKNPVIKRMLSTQLGDSYIAYYTERLATFFDLYFHKFPRYHYNCGGVLLYGLVNKQSNAYGFFCRVCKTPISIDDLDELSYQKRKYEEKHINN